MESGPVKPVSYREFFQDLEPDEEIHLVRDRQEYNMNPTLFRPSRQVECDASWIWRWGMPSPWEIVIPGVRKLTGLISDLLSLSGHSLKYVEVRDKDDRRLERLSMSPLEYPAHSTEEVQNDHAKAYDREATRVHKVIFRVEKSGSEREA